MDIAIAHLPPQTPIIPFTTKDEATSRAEIHADALEDGHLKGQYLVFTNVPQSAMDYWCWSDKGVLHSGRFNYSKASQIMVLKIPKPDILHEVLCAWDHVWHLKEYDIGLYEKENRDEYYIFHGYLSQLIFVDMIKQTDRYYRTGPLRGGGCTVVIEAGLPCAEARLDFDARRWLEAEGGNVSMAVAVVVWEVLERIVVKTWEYVGTETGEEEKGKGEIACTQEVVIRRRNGKTVSTGGMRFPFKTIFGREPDPNKPVERDIVLEESDLVRVGKRAWREIFGKDVED
jgi:hypothetical protein